MSKAPEDPCGKPRQSQSPHLHDRRFAADCGDRPEVAIAEWSHRLPLQLRDDPRRDIGALLLGDRRRSRQRPTLWAHDIRHVADDKYLGMAGNSEISADEDASGAVRLGVEPFSSF